MSLSGSKNKTSASQTQQFNQSATQSLSPRAWDMINGRMSDLGKAEYKSLDPSAYKQYENPYQQEVIDATTADINANRALAGNSQRADIARAGAFGDNRRGIMEAELEGQYDRTLATTLGGLRARGYEQSLGVAQGENTNKNQFDQMTQQQINQLLALLSQETTTTGQGASSGTSRGKTSGFNLGFTYGS